MKKVIILSRVSTQSQDNQRQILDLSKFGKKQGWSIEKVFEEKISGAKTNEERKVLLDAIDYAVMNGVHTCAVWELSRLGRSTIQVLRAIQELHAAKVNLYVHNFSLNTLSENGEENALSKFLVTLLAEVSAMERTQIRQRMSSGFKNHIAKGLPVGRKKGSNKTDEKLLEENKEALKLLKKGKCSIREISVLVGKSPTTIVKIKKAMETKLL
jgi:DNA invertase Pin-like site-specific DNA recombinase